MRTLLRDDPAPGATGPGAAVSPWRDVLVVLAVAAALRLVAGVLLSGTYDYDEFILLALSRQFAHGSHPYRDFLFFHPPGSLLVGKAIDPLTAWWWPAGRVFTAAADSLTAALTYAAGRRFLPRRTALLAGLIYAASPLTLIAGVRIGPDPLIACLGLAGLCLLLHSTSTRAAVLAGALLGLAVGTKYTAVLLVPAYVLVAPRRSWATAAGAAGAGALLMWPYLPLAHAVVQQTVVYQSGRGYTGLADRLGTVGLYWLAAAPAAVLGLRRRVPAWVKAGFAAGGVLLLAPQVYYHYFVLFAPFAALLSAPVVAGLGWPRRRTLALLSALALGWVGAVAVGGDRPLLVTAARLTRAAPAVQLIRTGTPSGSLILADRYEYPFLAGRPPLTPYFWSVRSLVKGTTLLRQLPCASAVVLAGGASSGYPLGLTNYLNSHYHARRLGQVTVWVLPGHGGPAGFGFHPACERLALVPRRPCSHAPCGPTKGTDEVLVVVGARAGHRGHR